MLPYLWLGIPSPLVKMRLEDLKYQENLIHLIFEGRASFH